MNILADPAAERGVLAGICKHGEEAYFDVADLLQSTTFTIDSNASIYRCLQHIFQQDEHGTIDVASIYSAAKSIGILQFLEKKTEVEHLKAIFGFPISLDNVRLLAGKIRRLQVARLVREQLQEASDKYLELNGDESIVNILGIAEGAVFDLSSLLSDNEGGPVTIGKGLVDYVTYLGENPIDQLGLSTGFKHYDNAIGGGLRPGTVNIIGARPKVGKTILSDNMGYHLASQGVPVLNMDTEMRKEDHQHRTLAMLTESTIGDIETGKYAAKLDVKERVLKAARKLEEDNVPYHHISISGMGFEDQLSIMRRWLAKEVGFNDDGTAKECVVIYDYLKLMDSHGISADMKEYQLLGFMMTTLHNFAMRYQIPVLAFMQLNRDGINKEDTDVAAGSDRIIWLCSNFAIFKKKSDEEIAEDGSSLGNRKLVPIISRHGEEWHDKNYINCDMKGWCAKVTEGKTKFEAAAEEVNNKGFEVEEDDEEYEEQIPF